MLSFFNSYCVPYTIYILLIVDGHTDYAALNTLLTFKTNEMEVCVSIIILDDYALEPVESFGVTLKRTSDLIDRVTFSPAEGTVTIVDDDGE